MLIEFPSLSPYLVTWIPSGVRHPINNLQGEIINRGAWELRAEEIKKIQTRYWESAEIRRNRQKHRIAGRALDDFLIRGGTKSNSPASCGASR